MSIHSVTSKIHCFCAGFQLPGLFVFAAYEPLWWGTLGFFAFSTFCAVYFSIQETKDV